MNHSESVTKLAAALSKAQGEIENAEKNANNSHFGSKYADLAEIINTVRPVLTKHGLSVVQIPGYESGVVTVDTMLLHESGEWLSGVSAAPAPKQDPQGVGSAVTYLRRYSLAAVCAIAQEDDDGNAASRTNGSAQRQAVPKQNINEPEAACPECKGAMWDNRARKAQGTIKKNAPDFKCKDNECDGKYWPGQWPPKIADAKTRAILSRYVEHLADAANLTEKQTANVIAAAKLAEDPNAHESHVMEGIARMKSLLNRAKPLDPVAAEEREQEIELGALAGVGA